MDEPFDPGKAREQVGDEDLLREVASVFLEETPARLEVLAGALRRGDAAKVRDVAHGLRGASSNFAAEPMMQIAGALEEMGRLEMLDGAADAFAELCEEYGRLRRALAEDLDLDER